MRFSRLSRILLSIVVCGFSLALCLSSVGVSAAGPDCNTGGVTCPYFKAFGGDVFTGGAFNTVANSTNCTTTATPGYYQSNNTTAGAGGIYAFSKDNGQNSAGGSSGQYGVFSDGPIDASGGGAATPYGFYSAGSQAGGPGNSKKVYTSFSDDTSSNKWGGNFDGTTPSLSHCIPDYYDLKNNAAIPITSGTSVSSLADGQQYAGSDAAPTPFVLMGGSISGKTTIFIDGSVYIGSPITYSYSNDTHVPKFALVVKGSIYLAPGISQIDGLYIAQPKTTAANDTTGTFWTCHDQLLANNLSVWFNNNCNNRLTVNGAVIAKQIFLMRENGNVGGASTAEDTACNSAAATQIQSAINSNCPGPAEIFNYVPAMIIGGPFFNQQSKPYQVNSIINLPPVF